MELSRSVMKVPASDANAIGLVIRKTRKVHGLTQAELAGLAGTGVRFVSELERGKPGVELGKLLEVLAVLGLRLLIVEEGS